MKTVFLVALGGACGALLRLAAQAAAAPAAWPWGTLLVNAGGCLAIGVLLGAFAGAAWFDGAGRPFLLVGVLGAFTTFSAFSAETLELCQRGRWAAAAAYVGASVVASLLAVYAGHRLGSAWR